MSWEILILIAAAILLILLIVFRKNPYVKKYWKYALILIPGLIIVVIRCFIKDGKDNSSGEESIAPLQRKVDKLKDDLSEANLEAAVEISAARAKDEQKIEEIKEIKKIPDQKERLKKLAKLVG